MYKGLQYIGITVLHKGWCLFTHHCVSASLAQTSGTGCLCVVPGGKWPWKKCFSKAKLAKILHLKRVSFMSGLINCETQQGGGGLAINTACHDNAPNSWKNSPSFRFSHSHPKEKENHYFHLPLLLKWKWLKSYNPSGQTDKRCFVGDSVTTQVGRCSSFRLWKKGMETHRAPAGSCSLNEHTRFVSFVRCS